MTNPEKWDPTPEEWEAWLDVDQQWRKVLDDPATLHAGAGIAASLVHAAVTAGMPRAAGLIARTDSDVLHRTLLVMLTWLLADLREHLSDEQIDAEAARRFAAAGDVLFALLEPTPDDLSGLEDGGTINQEET